MNAETLRAIGDSLLSVELFELSGTRVTLATAVIAVLIIVATLVGSRLARRGLELWFGKRGLRAPGTLHAANRLIHYVILFAGLAIALQTLGLKLAGLFTAGAVFAVGLGFAMQDITQNFVSGVILLAERVIKKDDILRVDDKLVRVEELGIRSTIVRTRDGLELIVPNSTIVQSTVVNYTLKSTQYRVRITVGVTYDADLDRVKQTLEGVVRELSNTWDQGEREPLVFLVAFGSSSIDFQVGLWIEDPWRERFALSDLHFGVWRAFKREGIVIAFPQLDLHFDKPVESALVALSGT